MKTRTHLGLLSIICFFFHIVLTGAAFSQVPQRISYQAIIRQTDGALVKNSNIGTIRPAPALILIIVRHSLNWLLL